MRPDGYQPDSSIYPGERQALMLVQTGTALTDQQLDELQDHVRKVDGKHFLSYGLFMVARNDLEKALILPSEQGFPVPRAFLRANRTYSMTLKLVSATLPAKEFELVIDPTNSKQMVRVLGSLPKASRSWLQKLEQRAETRRSYHA